MTMQARRILPHQADRTAAAQFQASLLPRECPRCADAAVVSALYQPASGTGGDFYDIIPVGDDERWFLIGDVCSRGTASALLMSLVLGFLWGALRAGAEPVDVARSLNDFLLNHSDRVRESSMVTTLFLGALDLPTLTMRYINAGHPCPYVQRNGADHTAAFGTQGLLLGVDDRADWIQAEIEFLPGDRIILCTDGMHAALTAAGEALGEQGLLELLDAWIGEDDATLLKRVSAAIPAPRPMSSPVDDRTIMLTSFLKQQRT